MDLVFVVDRSGSIGSDNFQKVRNYLVSRINAATFTDASGVRMGIVAFGTDTAEICGLQFSKSAVVSCAENIVYPTSLQWTDTPAGIKKGGQLLDAVSCNPADRFCILEGRPASRHGGR